MLRNIIYIGETESSLLIESTDSMMNKAKTLLQAHIHQHTCNYYYNLNYQIVVTQSYSDIYIVTVLEHTN